MHTEKKPLSLGKSKKKIVGITPKIWGNYWNGLVQVQLFEPETVKEDSKPFQTLDGLINKFNRFYNAGLPRYGQI